MARTRPLSPLLWLLAALIGVLALAAHPASASAAGGAGTRVGLSEQISAARTGVSAAESVDTQRGNRPWYGGLVVGDLLATDATATIPGRATNVLSEIDSTGAAPSGLKGGGQFANDGRGGGQVLPQADGGGGTISYQEWDVNPAGPGGRDAVRVVTGSDGSAWYTDDHYGTFTRIR